MIRAVAANCTAVAAVHPTASSTVPNSASTTATNERPNLRIERNPLSNDPSAPAQSILHQIRCTNREISQTIGANRIAGATGQSISKIAGGEAVSPAYGRWRP
ncbi:hypothetical protein MPUL_33010 [Mycolicibacterium pulveris]|uniref:Uncharacterized protein n=1 Tax=Mycolicibacterium pulveris TaxID=36813 RepID=A0A7I7UMP9_MYCPV|nr:hypothetical protein MPUL_33010 [Mycolicibacterium pulveris]